MDDTIFSAYFNHHRRDAVMLHRPYPPHTGPRTNSKFGGLPRLPAHYEWPRDANGVALHFLAQVDCADIGFETPLPERGVLFFFARDDEARIWNDKNWVGDLVKVIYAVDAFAATPTREHPADLKPIGGYYRRGLLQKGEDGPVIHIEWPIQPLRVDSWSDALFDEEVQPVNGWVARLAAMIGKAREPHWKEEEARQHAYADAHDIRFSDAFSRATGERLVAVQPINQERLSGKEIFEHAKKGNEAFPFYWINIRHAARYFICALEVDGEHSLYDTTQLPAARKWLARVEDLPDDDIPGDADREAFRAWLMHWHKPRPEVIPDPIRYAAAVYAAMLANIRSWSGNREMAAKIPPYVYNAMRDCFAADSGWGLKYSQMLGHAPSAQEPLHPNDPTLCLLNLCSDSALGTMYGDVGNAIFIISQQALARKDFAQVEADVVGH